MYIIYIKYIYIKYIYIYKIYIYKIYIYKIYIYKIYVACKSNKYWIYIESILNCNVCKT